MPHNPDRLLVTQKADVLAVDIHRMVRAHHRQVVDSSPGLRNQLLRAAVSISANLSEACGYHEPRKSVALIDVAIGSCNEVERMLTLMQRLELLDPSAHQLVADVQLVRKLAYGFRKRVLQGPANNEP